MAALSAPAWADDAAPPTAIVVFGDSQAAGLARGLQRVLVEDPHYKVLNRTHAGAALVHKQDEWLDAIERFSKGNEKADIAVVMFGANDRLDLRDDDGGYLHFRSDAWRSAYAARIDKIMTLLAGDKLKVLWCGNPIAKSAVYSADMGYINDIYAAEAAKFGAKFVPLWSVVADDQGRFTAYGKDRDGTTERMRADDGIHFTAAGYEVIADKILGLLSTTATAAASAAAPPPAPVPVAVPVAATQAATAAGPAEPH